MILQPIQTIDRVKQFIEEGNYKLAYVYSRFIASYYLKAHPELIDAGCKE